MVVVTLVEAAAAAKASAAAVAAARAAVDAVALEVGMEGSEAVGWVALLRAMTRAARMGSVVALSKMERARAAVANGAVAYVA